jgi:hypothetical protein
MGIPSKGYLRVRVGVPAEREHSRFSLNDTLAHCVENQLRRIVQVELFEDVAAMGFYGVGADVQLGSNFVVELFLHDFRRVSGVDNETRDAVTERVKSPVGNRGRRGSASAAIPPLCCSMAGGRSEW